MGGKGALAVQRRQRILVRVLGSLTVSEWSRGQGR